MIARTTFIAAAAVAVLAATPARSAAQQEAPLQAVSVNPIGAVFQLYSGEFERSVSPRLSVGLSSSYWGGEAFDEEDSSAEVDYLSVDTKLRYYPSGRGLSGFSLGGTVGYTTLSGELTDADGTAKDRAHAFSAGVVLDYNWLLGDRQQFLVGSGLGAKRVFVRDVEDDDLSLAYPTLRLSVGYAF